VHSAVVESEFTSPVFVCYVHSNPCAFLKRGSLMFFLPNNSSGVSSTTGFRMPRVGDPEASSFLRMFAEFGYLSLITAGCLFDNNLYRYGMGYMPTFLYWSKILSTFGESFAAYNLLWLVLDKIDSHMARPFTRWWRT
jgi:hypothetical protein